MVKWEVKFKRTAIKDAELLASAGLKERTQVLLKRIAEDPFAHPPPCEKLIGDLNGFFSRRINRQHRLVYRVISNTKLVEVFRMWSHYD